MVHGFISPSKLLLKALFTSCSCCSSKGRVGLESLFVAGHKGVSSKPYAILEFLHFQVLSCTFMYYLERKASLVEDCCSEFSRVSGFWGLCRRSSWAWKEWKTLTSLPQHVRRHKTRRGMQGSTSKCTKDTLKASYRSPKYPRHSKYPEDALNPMCFGD